MQKAAFVETKTITPTEDCGSVISMENRVWRHLTSPLSARAIILVLLLGIITYMAVERYFDHLKSDQRHNEIIQNQEEARVTREDMKAQNAVTVQAVDNLQAAINQIPALTQSVKDVAEILQHDRMMRQKEHNAIVQALRQQRLARRALKDCYELTQHSTKIGSNEVVTYDLVSKDKCH